MRSSDDDARFHTKLITSVSVNKESTLTVTGDVSGKARVVNLLNLLFTVVSSGLIYYLDC